MATARATRTTKITTADSGARRHGATPAAALRDREVKLQVEQETASSKAPFPFVSRGVCETTNGGAG